MRSQPLLKKYLHQALFWLMMPIAIYAGFLPIPSSFCFLRKKSSIRMVFEQCKINASKTVFQVYKDGKFFGKFQTPLMGEHNLLNALPVIAICHHIGIDHRVISSGLESFKGVKRRQEIRGIKNGVTVMDDFAHHPTAVRETIRAVKPFYPTAESLLCLNPVQTPVCEMFFRTFIRFHLMVPI
jgi:UDP-N-acetylmuramate-alanine ligase